MPPSPAVSCSMRALFFFKTLSMKVVCEAEIREGLPHDIIAAADRLIVLAETLCDATHSVRVEDGAELVRIEDGLMFVAYAMLSAL